MTKALIIGAGPSFKRNVQELRQSKFLDGDHIPVLCMDRSFVMCLDVDLIPDYMVTLEKEETLLRFYSKTEIIEKGKSVVAIHSHKTLKSQVDRFKQFGMETMMFPSTKYIMEQDEDLHYITSFTWAIAADYLHADEIYFIGTDFAWSQRDFYSRRGKESEFNPILKTDFFTNGTYKGWKKELFKVIEQFPKVKTYNCTGTGLLFGDRIEWKDKI